jgi:putative transferase (TIGR04331 family)
MKEKYNITTISGYNFTNNDYPILCLDGWVSFKYSSGFEDNYCEHIYSHCDYSSNQRDQKYIYINMLELELMASLTASLNEIHGVNKSIRFWKILTGHWLRNTIRFIYNRYETLSSLLNKYDIQSICLLKCDYELVVPKDYKDYSIKLNDNSTDSFILRQILIYLKFDHLIVDVDNDVSTDYIENNNSKKEKSIFVRRFAAYLSKITKQLNFDSSPVITRTKMTRLQEVLLQLSFYSLPYYLDIKGYKDMETDSVKRKSLCSIMTGGAQNIGFEGLIMNLISKMIPKSYFEEYKFLHESANNLHLPISPKFIFTSNNFIVDDVFKLWIANNVEKGVKYFIGQHGNNYGECKFDGPHIEEVTADKFITWGWKYNSKHLKGFILNKYYNKFKYKEGSNKPKNLLFIDRGKRGRKHIEDVSNEYERYLNSKKDFYTYLDDNIKDRLVIRPPQIVVTNNTLGELRQWSEISQNIQVEITNLRIDKLVNKSKLVVCFYQGTSLLELLAANYPVVGYLDRYDNLNVESKKYYDLLVEVGICHLDANSLATQVNLVWKNISAWWYSEIVMKAKKEFCANYARTTPSPVIDIRKLILDNISN